MNTKLRAIKANEIVIDSREYALLYRLYLRSHVLAVNNRWVGEVVDELESYYEK